MDQMKLEGRRVEVVGLGRSGEAAARFLLGRGARVSCSDTQTGEQLGEIARRLSEAGCTLRLGGQRPGDFADADLIVVSPGVPMTLPPLTTVSLIHHLLETAGIPHWTGGNIGRPLTEFLLEAPHGPGTEAPRVILIEVSSFQLETIVEFRPWIAVWTNLSPDHLDRYPDMEAYAGAKARIFLNQTADDYALIPTEDAWLDRTGARGRIRASVLHRGHGPDPQSDIRLEQGDVCLRLDRQGPEERYPTDRVRLLGRHNLENIMTALAVARLSGAAPDRVQAGMESFQGLEHRLECVGERNGVRFFNDSKATTVVSVVCALESFDRPVLLLAGGKDKGGSYAPLREPLRERVRVMFLFGQAAGRMQDELTGACEIRRVKDLDEAVRNAGQCARPGETVLLSPACSSFDMFRDYEDRGEQFKQRVRGIIRGDG